jgi:hypothetical protein
MRSIALARATTILAIYVMLSSLGCAKPPPNLTPVGTAAFQKTQVIKGLDLLRDFAIDAEAQTPKVLPTATTRRIVQYHQSALKVIQSTDAGWQGAVETSLDEVVANLSPSEREKVTPYVALVKTILREVAR